MKEVFISDIKKMEANRRVAIYGWIASVRVGKERIFFDIVDSTGRIQVITDRGFSGKKEESVFVSGTTHIFGENFEIVADEVKIIGRAEITTEPSPRSKFDLFSSGNAAKVLQNRHLYLRNDKMIASLKARHAVTTAIREWFESQNYCEVTSPILSPVILYDEDTAIKAEIENSVGDVFLTQCVGFYLESAVHALERVYNIGPSFRAKETASRRHLNEYWHVKSECAFVTFEEFFGIVEDMLKTVTKKLQQSASELCSTLGTEFNADALKAPFPRITYIKALELLGVNGIDIEFGRSINDAGENYLSEYFGSPVWVTHNPASVEGFPYKYDRDRRLTVTADLIWSKGHGEVLGIADKITDYAELSERMKEKGKANNSAYQWFAELRQLGTVPHCGMGMGLERLIKCLFGINHVRDVIPFPRNIGKKIYP